MNPTKNILTNANNIYHSFLSTSTVLLLTSQNQSLLIDHIETNDLISSKITKIILIFLVSFMVFMTIAGNLLVIIAFICEPTIRTYSNYFILNLSIADLLVGLIWYV
jgi:nitrate reductase gamma subunit